MRMMTEKMNLWIKKIQMKTKILTPIQIKIKKIAKIKMLKMMKIKMNLNKVMQEIK